MRLSVLDQSIAVAGRPHDQSIRNTVALAKHCEALGYDRFWVSEHHNHPDHRRHRAGDRDCRDRRHHRAHPHRQRRHHAAALRAVQSGRGVPRARRPGAGPHRLGLGRAPGSDGRTAFALNPAANERPEHFPADVRDLIAWVHNEPLVDRHPFAAVKAYPQGPTAPEVWILGSSDYGAQVAALFGLPYCYAWFFSDGAGGERAIDLYKRTYRPSARHPEPHSALCVLGARRPDDGRGAVPFHLARALAHQSRSGHPGTAGDARRRGRSASRRLRPGAGRPVPQGLLRRHRPGGRRAHRGAPERVGVDEMAVVTWTHDEDVRRASYTELAKAADFMPQAALSS